MTFSISKRKLSKKLNNLIVYKRILGKTFLFFLLIAFSNQIFGADREWKVIHSGQFQGLADAEGNIIIPPVYDAIGWSDGSTNVFGEVIGFMENGTWGLISLRNKKLTNPQFAVLLPDEPGMVKAAIKGKFSNLLFYGLLDDRGEVLIDFNHFSIDKFDHNLLLVAEYRNRNVFYGLIDNSNRTIISKAYSKVYLSGNLIVGENRGKKKVFDLQGRPIFDFWLDRVEAKDDGVLVLREGEYGFVENSGRVRYEVKYKSIKDRKSILFNQWIIQDFLTEEEVIVDCDSLSLNMNGIWIAHINHSNHLLYPSQSWVFNSASDQLVDVRGNYLLIQNQKNLSWSVYEESGAQVLSGKDQIIMDSTYMFVQNKGRWNVYDYSGQKVNDRTLEEVLGARASRIVAKNHGYWGWLNASGEMAVKFKYDEIEFGIKNEQFIAKYINNWGVFDFAGSYIISPEYGDLYAIGNYYVAVKGSAKRIFSTSGVLLYTTTGSVTNLNSALLIKEEAGWGAILPNQEFVAPAFDSVELISGFYQLTKGEFISMIDQEGKEIVRLEDQVEKVLEYSEDFFLIKKEGRYGFMDLNGQLRIANRYDSARSFSGGMSAIKLIGKWGFIDKDETLRVQPFYDAVEDFSEGLAIVNVADKYGIVNQDGDEVVALEWKKIRRQTTGNFVVTDFENRQGLVNIEGEIILSPVFESLVDTSLELAVASRYGLKGVLDYQGYSKFPFKYKDIKIEENYILLLNAQQD